MNACNKSVPACLIWPPKPPCVVQYTTHIAVHVLSTPDACEPHISDIPNTQFIDKSACNTTIVSWRSCSREGVIETESDVARGIATLPTSDALVRQVMQLNNRSQAETPTPSGQSRPTAPVAYQTYILSTQPTSISTPDPSLTPETFSGTR